MASSSSSSSSANSSPPSESSPWDLVTTGKGDWGRKLREQYAVNKRGGLECQGCGCTFSREELEKANRNSGMGPSGMLNGHFQSQQHKTGKPKEGKSITSFFRAASSQPQSSSTPRQETPPAAGGGPAPARTGGPVIESVEDEDEEDNEGIAATYIQTFDSLPQDVQCSIAQAVTPKVRRCAGFRPKALEACVDLLTHVPAAYLYASGSYTTTNMERLTGRVQLRQDNFHALGCLEFAIPGGTKCTKCSAFDPEFLMQSMPYLGDPFSKIPTTLNDGHFSQHQMKEKKDSIRDEERKKSLQLLTMKRKVHRHERALGLYDRLLLTLTSGNARLMQATLVQAHKMGRSVAGMLEMATKCLENIYRPRPRFTDLDMSLGMLLYPFGGEAAAHAANKALGLPCPRRIQKAKELTAFMPIVYTGICMYARDVKTAVVANLRAGLLKPIQEGKMELRESYRGQWMLLLDGSCIDKKVRHHPRTDTIIGPCEHVPVGIKLRLDTPHDGAAVLAALKEGQDNPDSSRAMHLAEEAVVVCLKPITGKGQDSLLVPVAVAPTCNKRSNLDHQQQLLTAAEAIIKKAEKAGYTMMRPHGRLVVSVWTSVGTWRRGRRMMRRTDWGGWPSRRRVRRKRRSGRLVCVARWRRWRRTSARGGHMTSCRCWELYRRVWWGRR
jgi:hypothetical protein